MACICKPSDTVVKDPSIIKQILKELSSKPSKKTLRENAKAKAAYLALTK